MRAHLFDMKVQHSDRGLEVKMNMDTPNKQVLSISDHSESPLSSGSPESTPESSPEGSSRKHKSKQYPNKPAIERQRRARMNEHLSEMKLLIMHELKDQPGRLSKLDKSEILEMTVKHLKQGKSGTGNIPQDTYHQGYSECAWAVQHFLSTCEGVDPELRIRMINHLAGRIHQTLDTSPGSAHQLPLPAPASYLPAPSPAPATGRTVEGVRKPAPVKLGVHHPYLSQNSNFSGYSIQAPVKSHSVGMKLVNNLNAMQRSEGSSKSQVPGLTELTDQRFISPIIMNSELTRLFQEGNIQKSSDARNINEKPSSQSSTHIDNVTLRPILPNQPLNTESMQRVSSWPAGWPGFPLPVYLPPRCVNQSPADQR